MTRYNWKRLKIEFFKSRYKHTLSWWKAKGFSITGQYLKQTKGWSKQKYVLYLTGEIPEKHFCIGNLHFNKSKKEVQT